MFRRTTLLIGTLLFALVLAGSASGLVGTVRAEGPEPQHSDPMWQASYWNNMNLAGNADLQRMEPSIDYDWGFSSPQPGLIQDDHFSARWSRYIEVPAGRYRFTATSDDGIRVSVDSQRIIDDWSDHAVRTVSAEMQLSGEHHLVVVEYYENSGQAVARFSWSPLAGGDSWLGEYFSNTGLNGQPALVRQDARISFDWGYGSPAPGTIPADRFSVRWTQTRTFPAGTYTFSTTVDDGVRLWINGHLLIDAWQVQSVRTFSGSIYLSGGEVPLKMEYFEESGQAVAQLEWRNDGPPPPPPPPNPGAIVVDNGDAGFQIGGKAANWGHENIGYDGDMLWTRNNDQVRPEYNWARWYPQAAHGRYEVFVYVPARFATTTQARYWISHRDGFTLQIVNQLAYSNEWVSLGTYNFRGTGSDFVSLADVTFEPYLSRQVGFDAVKWERR